MIYVLAKNRMHAQQAIRGHAMQWNKSPADYRYIGFTHQLHGMQLGKGEYFLKYETWPEHPQYSEMKHWVRMIENISARNEAWIPQPWYVKAWNWVKGFFR